jgi:hypothetical protein
MPSIKVLLALLLAPAVATGSAALQSQQAFIQNLAERVQKTGGKISDNENSALVAIKETMNSATLPDIQSNHNSDQKELNDAAKVFELCEAQLNGKADDVSALNTATTQAKKDLADCKTEQARLAGLKNDVATLQGALTDMLSADSRQAEGGNKPLCAMPPAKQSYADVEQFLADSAAFFSTNKDELKRLNDLHDTHSGNLDAQAKECDAQEIKYPVKYCQLQTLVTDAAKTYGECRTAANTDFEAIKARVLKGEKSRKNDFTAVKHMLCFLDVLISQDAEAGDKLTACQSLTVDNSHLTIVVPDIVVAQDTTTKLAIDADGSVSC